MENERKHTDVKNDQFLSCEKLDNVLKYARDEKYNGKTIHILSWNNGGIRFVENYRLEEIK